MKGRCARYDNNNRPSYIENRSGLTLLKYRVGTYSQFKSRMLASLSGSKTLVDLTTRQDDDLAIALLDCWATVSDVLTFYQERIANEGYVRTATERRSIKELARMVGYELRPGVAASTFLAFTVEDAPGTLEKTTISAGTKVQSIPAAGEMPQVFETIEDIEARPEWNKLRPRVSMKQDVGTGRELIFKGTNTMLKPGDLLLIVAESSSVSEMYDTAARIVASVQTENTAQTTTVETVGLVEQGIVLAIAKKLAYDLSALSLASSFEKVDSGAKLNLISAMAHKSLTESQVRVYARSLGWNKKKLATAVNFRIGLQRSLRAGIPEWVGASLPEPQAGVYAFRSKGSFFGHNAPKYSTLPKEQEKEISTYVVENGVVKTITTYDKKNMYPLDWDASPLSITQKSSGGPWPGQFVYLDNTYPSLVNGSWAVIRDANNYSVYRISQTTEQSLADFAMSAKVTGLKLSNDDLNNQSMGELGSFKIRASSAYLQSELLELADVPIETPVEGSAIELDRIVTDLRVGQLVSVTGEILLEGEPAGLNESEVVVISDIVHSSGNTILVFTRGLENSYRRRSVIINANVANATHGETKDEALGSGDPSKSMQEFTLKQKPLTFVTSSTAEGGAASTLSVYVNNILWSPALDLYGLGPNDRKYVMHIENEDQEGYGSTKIVFGNGLHGMRPQAGTNNIVAKYRAGMGQAGLVDEGQLSLLLTRPLGVKGVTNPMAATGAADPERLEHARINAPLPLIAMGRIVSLTDFEDFARAFAGIGKAQATWMWDGEKRVVLLTIASDNGERVAETSKLYDSLAGAVENSKDPAINARILSFVPRLFKVEARVAVAADHLVDNVFAKVRETLLDKFSFESRQFAQPVTLSDIVSAIQRVDGVVAADVDSLYSSESSEPSLVDSIPAWAAHWESTRMVAAELLTIDPDGIILAEMTH